MVENLKYNHRLCKRYLKGSLMLYILRIIHLFGEEVVDPELKSGWSFNSAGKDQRATKVEDKCDQVLRGKNRHIVVDSKSIF